MELENLDLNKVDDRVRIFDLMHQYLLRKNFLGLKRLSNNILEFADGNRDLIYLSYLPYVIYKMLTQPHIVKSKKWNGNKEKILKKLDEMEKKPVEDYITLVKNFKEIFKKSDNEMYRYIRNILKKGKTKQAAKLYSLGMSQKKAIELTDADEMDVRHYLHHSKEHNVIRFDEEITKKVNFLKKEIKKNPVIVFDSSTLISLGNACLFGILVKLKKKYPITFAIPEGVLEEAVEVGERVNKFAWNAARIQRLIDHKIIDVIKVKDVEHYKDLEKNTNHIFKTNHGYLEILQKGELEAIMILKENNGKILAVDELTMRLLIEKPSKLRKMTERRYRTDVKINQDKLKKYSDEVSDLKIVRSVDIVALAYDLGLFSEYIHQDILKSLLYSLKYNGCATTFEEIEDYVEKR